VQEGPENSGFLGTFGIMVKIGLNAWEAAVLPLNYARKINDLESALGLRVDCYVLTPSYST
jgi:hypothetical protein